MRTHIYNKLTADEIEAYLNGGGDTILISVGVIEYHGKYPVDCESVLPEAFASLLAEKMNALALINLPVFYAGGTVISNATIELSISDGVAYLDKICTSLVNQGFKRIYLLEAHGPAKLTIDTFCAEFFQKTLIHPCHLGVIPMVFKAAGLKNFADLYSLLTQVSYGAYEIMGQTEYIQVTPGEKDQLIHMSEPNSLVKEMERMCGEYGGRLCSIYDELDQHGGGMIFSSNESRDSYCAEGARVMKELIDKIDINAMNETLAKYQDYVKRVEEKYPRLKL